MKSKSYFFPAELVIFVIVNFLEDVGGGCRIADIDEFHFKQKSCTAWNDVASAPVTVSEVGRYRQFALLSNAHVRQTFIPAFYHLPNAQLEWKRLVPVQAGKQIARVKFTQQTTLFVTTTKQTNESKRNAIMQKSHNFKFYVEFKNHEFTITVVFFYLNFYDQKQLVTLVIFKTSGEEVSLHRKEMKELNLRSQKTLMYFSMLTQDI